MTALADQLAAFAQAHGGTLRHGPQAPKLPSVNPPSIGRTQQNHGRKNRDPYLEYTDDYSVWKQGQ
jgi:hypothetical protein